MEERWRLSIRIRLGAYSLVPEKSQNIRGPICLVSNQNLFASAVPLFQTLQHEDLRTSESVFVGETALTRAQSEWRSEERAKGDLLTAAKTTVLQEQLENARQLVEIEPDSKWPLLTTALLMSALQDPKFANETLAVLDTLIKVDPYRKNYYEDLKSKLIIETSLEPNAENVDLSGKGITCLRHCHLMSATVFLNLSGNRLRDPFLHQLRHCARLKSLVLDGNLLHGLDFLEVLPGLKTLSVKDCGKASSSFRLLRFSRPKHSQMLLIFGP